MAKVKVQLGYTKNMGDFESLRADFGFEDEIREDESVEDAQRRAYDMVERELISKLTELVEEWDEVHSKDK